MKWSSLSAFLSLRVLIALLLCASACLTAVGRVPAFLQPEARLKASHPAAAGLNFEQRVSYQRAIEEVYWRHRIWPKENPEPKPSLDAIISQRQIEQKVEDYLRKSQLITAQRGLPITASELQGEMERMATHTRDPDMLRELFVVLGSDPFVIAECLAKPILAERLVSPLRGQNGAGAFVSNATALNATRSAIARYQFTYEVPEISPLDCTDDTWTATSTVNAPTARDGHAVIWTGSEMIVWGGAVLDPAYHYFNTGGRYSPATDSWTATSTTNAPIARWLHTAVWTGSEMIVWGGYGGDFFNTGGRYNATTDTWTPTNTTNAPTARVHHTAVWTGSEMMAWGGYNYTNGRFNSGGRYNPSTDSWTATSITNTPEARWGHNAEWTGSEMIVWGGTNSMIYLNTGGRYSPEMDSWTATGVPNNVLGRVAHSAVWTGSEMIVWGGVDSTFNDCNTGGRYNPTADSWSATSTINAPHSRDSLAAVWTGSEMIVWGGGFCCPGVEFNTGGRYNAGIDSWTPTSTANAPFPRYSLQYLNFAVWTGSEMIVWGGYNHTDNLFFNTGGKYCAQSGATPTPTPTATASPTATPTATATPTPTPTPRATPTPRVPPPPRARPTPRP